MKKEQAALKLALEALETLMIERVSIYDKAITAIREALADSALERMAENARELGLDYEPPCKTGSQCTSKCQQCEQPEAELKATERQVEILSDELSKCSKELAALKAQQQEPVAWPCVIAEADFEKDTITLEMQCSDYMVRAGQHWLSTSPQPSKPWVGLTDEEIDELDRKNYGFPQPVAWRGPFARAVEAKLKERNA